MEMLSRLEAGEADVIAFPLTTDSLLPGWLLDSTKTQLMTSLREWYQPLLLAEVRNEELRLLKGGGVKRRVYAPMLNRAGGIISRYDKLFQQYSRIVGWDWRLMAAQCYQESTFDPMAESWAGAKGLMQIMPSTADEVGLAPEDMYHPEKNIEAAARYMKKLDTRFSDIGDPRERQDFVLAAYNGGYLHIRDAMTLAERDGKNPRRWDDVAYYVLHLSEPQYYQDPLVQYGYMRGSETYNYVKSIREQWRLYRGVKTAPGNSGPQKSHNERHREKFQIQDVTQ
jgi:membrane-bound lytic murein transglycosylase F